MSPTGEGHREPGLRYLPASVVARHCQTLDVCSIIRDALVEHSRGSTLLPAEAYLGWTTPNGATARSIALPGGLLSGVSRPDQHPRLGLKVINSSLDNPSRGIPRAQGLILLFDPVTGRIETILEAARISATRTAAASVVAAAVLAARPPRTVAVIGCGVLARAHLELIRGQLPSVDRVHLMDLIPVRVDELADELSVFSTWSVERFADASACVADTDLVVTCTTSTKGYLPLTALAPGAVIVHVSLDDVLPEVVDAAELVVVDDWDLVSDDRRRLLGRLLTAGELSLPTPGDPRLTTIGAILTGEHPGRSSDAGLVLVNPFGMAVLDVALASAIATAAASDPAVLTLPV